MSDSKQTLVESLVAAAAEKDAVSFAEMFKTELADRIQERLANLKVEIASQMAGAKVSEEPVEEGAVDPTTGKFFTMGQVNRREKQRAIGKSRNQERLVALQKTKAEGGKRDPRTGRPIMSSYEPEGDELPEGVDITKRAHNELKAAKLRLGGGRPGSKVDQVPATNPSPRVGEKGGSISKSDADAGAKPLDPKDPVVQNRIPGKSVSVNKFVEPTDKKASVKVQQASAADRESAARIQKMKAIQSANRLKK